jgi:hypothetical protein
MEFPRKRHSEDPKFKFIFVIRTEDRKASTSNDAKKVIVRLLVKKIHTGNVKSNKGRRQSAYEINTSKKSMLPKF